MQTKALTTEELAGTTAGEREEKNGGPQGRAELAQEGAGKKTRRVMRCGDWISIGAAARDAALRDGGK